MVICEDCDSGGDGSGDPGKTGTMVEVTVVGGLLGAGDEGVVYITVVVGLVVTVVSVRV